MRIEQIRADLDVFSGRLSEITRQISLAGIGVIWIFKLDTNTGGITYTGNLSYPLLAFVLALLLDLLQYLRSYVVWDKLATLMDKNNEVERDVDPKINCLSTLLFYGKILSAAIGCAIVIFNIISQF